MEADPHIGAQTEALSSSGRDRLGLVLAGLGGVFAVLAALMLWQAQGAAIFLSATVNAVANCF